MVWLNVFSKVSNICLFVHIVKRPYKFLLALYTIVIIKTMSGKLQYVQVSNTN